MISNKNKHRTEVLHPAIWFANEIAGLDKFPSTSAVTRQQINFNDKNFVTTDQSEGWEAARLLPKCVYVASWQAFHRMELKAL